MSQQTTSIILTASDQTRAAFSSAQGGMDKLKTSA